MAQAGTSRKILEHEITKTYEEHEARLHVFVSLRAFVIQSFRAFVIQSFSARGPIPSWSNTCHIPSICTETVARRMNGSA